MKIQDIYFKVWIENSKRMIQPVEYADLLIKGDGRLFCWADIQENSGLIELTEQNNYTILFWVGLLDKDNKKIFEGDILLLENGGLAIVTYNDSRFTIVPAFDSQEQHALVNDQYLNFNESGGTSTKTGNCDWIKVLGNIYQNPELADPEVIQIWR